MRKILVIDDDADINNLVSEILTNNGFSVLRAWSGTEALMILEREHPDLVLLDLMLPGLSGEELLNEIHGVPVIVLSAKVDISDKVSLLSAGASDYITKPFDTAELLARINVQLRNTNGIQGIIYRCNGIEVDTASHSVKIDNKNVLLTKTEFAILKALISNQGNVLSKSAILDTICFDTPDCTEDSLKQHVSNLRKKIHEAGGKNCIESVWGIGFIMK